MKINEEILIRLKQIIEESGLSRRQFALGIGHAPSTITEIFTQRIRTLSGSVITILELKYGINPTWLETGMGDKWKHPEKINDHREIVLLRQFRSLTNGNKTMLEAFSETLHRQQGGDDEDESRVAEEKPLYDE